MDVVGMFPPFCFIVPSSSSKRSRQTKSLKVFPNRGRKRLTVPVVISSSSGLSVSKYIMSHHLWWNRTSFGLRRNIFLLTKHYLLVASGSCDITTNIFQCALLLSAVLVYINIFANELRSLIFVVMWKHIMCPTSFGKRNIRWLENVCQFSSKLIKDVLYSWNIIRQVVGDRPWKNYF